MDLRLKRAIDWLYRHGRPIDVARYEYLFLNRSKETYIRTLESFQNPDGGFGHGFEPDSQNPFSAPVQTWFAFDFIEELNLPKDHSLITKTVDYLLNYAQKKDGFYLATIPSNNIYPRAPWWTYTAEGSVWGYNPTAAIAGFLYKYGETKEAKEFAVTTIQRAINDFIAGPSNNMHEIKCFLDMIGFIADFKKFNNSEQFLGLLLKQIDHNLEKNADLWFKAYCVRPLQFFDKPTVYGYDKYQDLIKKEASMILEHLNLEGVWDITWTWDSFPEAFAIAKQDWQSLFILNYLKILKVYNII